MHVPQAWQGAGLHRFPHRPASTHGLTPEVASQALGNSGNSKGVIASCTPALRGWGWAEVPHVRCCNSALVCEAAGADLHS